MSGLVVKDVEFNGAIIKAAQDASKLIWVGVKWICDGIGLSIGQIQRQITNIGKDIVLQKGVANLQLPTNGGEQKVLCLMLDYLPLWLAKISITPTMQKENPELVEKLVTYQLKAKDVLAEAFLGKKNDIVPTKNIIQLQIPDMEDYSKQFAEINLKFDRLNDDLSKLAKIILSMNNNLMNKEQTAAPFLQENDSCNEWKRKMYSIMDMLLNKGIFSNRNEVMKYIYEYMNRNYGIVWEQEAKEYKERYDASKKPATIDIVYGNESYRSIFDSVLTDLVANQPEKNLIAKSDIIIKPLIEKYDDHSNAGMDTYKIVYEYMDSHSKIGWKNLTTRYINKYGSKSATKKNIINAFLIC